MSAAVSKGIIFGLVVMVIVMTAWRVSIDIEKHPTWYCKNKCQFCVVDQMLDEPWVNK